MTIRSEIETRLATLAKSRGIPVAYENVSFIKPLTGGYLEVHFLTSTSRNRDVAAQGVRITGMFQINCFAPLGKGMAEVEALSDAVIAAFPVLPKTGIVSIEAPLDAASAMELDGFVCLPVTGRYRVEL